MKLPHVKIVWDEDYRKNPVVVNVKKLTNGYLIGDTYFSTEDMMVKHLAEYVKNPDAYQAVPIYKDIPPQDKV